MFMTLGDRLLHGHAEAEEGQEAELLDILDPALDHLADPQTRPQCLWQNHAEEPQMLMATDAARLSAETRTNGLVQ